MNKPDTTGEATRLGGFFVEEYRIYWTAASLEIDPLYRLTPTILVMGKEGELAYLQFWNAPCTITPPRWDEAHKTYHANYLMEAFSEMLQLLEKAGAVELEYKAQGDRVWIQLTALEPTHPPGDCLAQDGLDEASRLNVGETLLA